MKKLVALALALLVAFGCMTAQAEDAYRILFTADDAQQQVTAELMIAQEGFSLLLRSGGQTACVLTAADHEDGLMLYSDLLPGYGVYAQARQGAAGEAQGEEALSQDRIERLRALAQPYIQRIADFVEQVQQNASFSEDYSRMTIDLSNAMVHDLARELAERFSADADLAAWLTDMLRYINFFLSPSQQLRGEKILDDLAEALQGLEGPADQAFATLTTVNHQDGTGVVTVEVPQRALITYETGSDTVVVRLGDADTAEGTLRITARQEQAALAIPEEYQVVRLEVLLARLIQDKLEDFKGWLLKQGE